MSGLPPDRTSYGEKQNVKGYFTTRTRRSAGRRVKMYKTNEEYTAFEKRMEKIIKSNTILRDYITLPKNNVEFDAFCERVSRKAHENSVLCI